MLEAMAGDELDRLLEAIPQRRIGLPTDRIGWPVVIDYQTFCQRLIAYGFTNTQLAQAKAALIEAELAYRYCGKIRREKP